MGAQNVTKVFAHWTHLNHREARALAFMANTALDSDSPPVYFAGWQALASALGLSEASSARRMTMQVFAALRESGAIVSSGQARMNVRAEYALALEPGITFKPQGSGRGVKWVQLPRNGDRVSQKNTQMDDPKRHADVHEKDTHQGEPKVQNRVSQKDTPRSTEEPLGGTPEEQRGGTQITNRSSLTNARASEPAALDENPSIEDERTRQLQALEERMAEEGRKAS